MNTSFEADTKERGTLEAYQCPHHLKVMIFDGLRLSLALLFVLPAAWCFTMMKSPLVLRARLPSSLKLCETLHSGPASTGKSRVFINNLPYDLEERELNGIISKYLGASFPSVALCKDRENGKSRGFALAHFENKEEADAAASALSTLIVHERSLSARTSDFVDGTRPPKPYPQETTCFIGNLAFTTSEEDIKALCHHHLGKSAIKRVKLITNPDSGRHFVCL